MNHLFVALTFLLTLVHLGDAAETAAKPAEQEISADQALELLREGNKRFVAEEALHPHENVGWRRALESAQHPFAVVLACSDSRVTPELVFDQGFGDLFVVRVAGNVVDTDVTASIEYAAHHLDTHLIVVMGHSGCGAVTATLDHLTDAGEPAEVVSLLFQIEPAVQTVPGDLPREQRLALAVKRNVDLAVRRLSFVPHLRNAVKEGHIKIIGAIYDMHTGKVQFLPPPIVTENKAPEASDK